MQTQTTSKTNPVELPIAQRIEAARAMLEKLQSAAEDAEADAKRWSTTFDREPTEQAAVAKLVAERKAINARAAVTEHETGTLGPLLAQHGQQEREALAAERNQAMASILRDLRSAEDVIVAGVHAFDAAINKLAGEHYQRVQAQQAGANLPTVSLERLVGEMNARLASLRAQNLTHTTDAVARFIAASNDSNVRFEFTRPAGHVPSPLR